MSDRETAEPETLNPSEALDEDELRVDPLEEGVEPPEHWSGADRFAGHARGDPRRGVSRHAAGRRGAGRRRKMIFTQTAGHASTP